MGGKQEKAILQDMEVRPSQKMGEVVGCVDGRACKRTKGVGFRPAEQTQSSLQRPTRIEQREVRKVGRSVMASLQKDGTEMAEDEGETNRLEDTGHQRYYPGGAGKGLDRVNAKRECAGRRLETCDNFNLNIAL